MKNRVKELRLAAGMTQQQLAELVHVSSRTIISLEKGQYNPSLLLAYRLALIFSTTVEELYCLQENKEEEDRDEDRDERNHWIELRSKATSYRVMFWMNAAWMIGCILGYTVAKDEIYIQMGLPCMVLWIAAGAARLVSELYYEQKS